MQLYESAQFTEYLRDYLNAGNELPTEFNSVPALNGVSFSELFKDHYLLNEIGFETEEIFTIKLRNHARLILPLYIDKINYYNNVKNTIDKIDTISDNEIITKNFINPAGNTSEPIADVNLSDAAKTNSQTGIHTTAKSKIELIDDYNKLITNLYEEILDAFKCCFMQIL